MPILLSNEWVVVGRSRSPGTCASRIRLLFARPLSVEEEEEVEEEKLGRFGEPHQFFS